LAYLDDIGTDFEELNMYCNRVVKFSVKRGERLFNTIFYYLFASMPFQSGYFYSRKMQNWVDSNIGNYDYIYCIHLRTAAYVKNNKNIIRFIDGIDAISLNYKNKLAHKKNMKYFINYLEYKRLCKYEKHIYNDFSKTILISDFDKEFIYNLGIKKKIQTVPNFVRDIGYDSSLHIEYNCISFMGLMSYEANINAVLYFVNEIYPTLKLEYPDLKFQIIGGNPSSEIRKLNGLNGIEVLGYVESPAEILQKSVFVIAPMVSGSGLQNKIIESMYLGKMVITTRNGANGLSHLSGEEIVIADNTEDFIKKSIYWLDMKHREELYNVGNKARTYVEKNYSYEFVENELISYLMDKEKELL